MSQLFGISFFPKGSSNGIHINNSRIPAHTNRVLADRDVVEFGKDTTKCEDLAVHAFQVGSSVDEDKCCINNLFE